MCTVEEHITTGGFGSSVLELLSDMPHHAPVHVLGIEAGSTQTGPYRELLDYYGLSADKLTAVSYTHLYFISRGQ